jgi:hypothetical protein
MVRRCLLLWLPSNRKLCCIGYGSGGPIFCSNSCMHARRVYLCSHPSCFTPSRPFVPSRQELVLLSCAGRNLLVLLFQTLPHNLYPDFFRQTLESEPYHRFKIEAPPTQFPSVHCFMYILFLTGTWQVKEGSPALVSYLSSCPQSKKERKREETFISRSGF